MATADLPGPGNPCARTTPVQVLDDGNGQADEGRAMTQIVHDIAPGAYLAFATAFIGEVAFADNIQALATAGADVIADDIIYFAEPYFQDGIVANAVNDVTAQGVAYFSMAFNNNRIIAGNNSNSWEAPAYRSGRLPGAGRGHRLRGLQSRPGVDSTFHLTSRRGAPAARPAVGRAPERRRDNLDLFVIDAAGHRRSRRRTTT